MIGEFTGGKCDSVANNSDSKFLERVQWVYYALTTSDTWPPDQSDSSSNASIHLVHSSIRRR